MKSLVDRLITALERMIMKITINAKGDITMKISKIKIIAKYFTGGLSSVIEYLLDLFNDRFQKLPANEVAKYAQLAKDVANFVQNIANSLISNEAKKRAAIHTAQAFSELATSLLDSSVTKDEMDGIVDAVKSSVQAWKEAK